MSQKPGQMLMLYRVVPLKSEVKGIEISARYRTAGVKSGAQPWFDSRAIFHFTDANGKPVKPDPKGFVFSTKAADWTTVGSRSAVPEGAVRLEMMPCLFQAAAGTLDLAEIRVTPISSEDVEAMNAAAAAEVKKKAGQTAIVNAELALPSKTAELKVSGNKLVTADGAAVWLQGLNVIPLEWSPNGEGGIPWSIHVAIDDWNANVIRLPVMENFWFGRGKSAHAPAGTVTSNDQEAYRAIVDSAVKLAAAKGAYIVLDLHRFLTPDDKCVAFWKDAAARYKNNPAVLFDIFNEPHGTTWEVWQKGGPVEVKQKDGTSKTIQSVGMQALVDAVRGTGAKNIIVAGGLAYAYDLTGILKGYALDDRGGNGIMYATHFYNWHKGWADHFLGVAEKYPVLVGETGASLIKMGFIPAADQEDPNTWTPDMIGLIQKYKLNWTAWSFHPRGGPALVTDLNYTPTPSCGAAIKDALHGKQFELKNMR
ncbi:MAG: glycoside hydrolase family 5 protein [Opitutaceae bacterium]